MEVKVLTYFYRRLVARKWISLQTFLKKHSISQQG